MWPRNRYVRHCLIDFEELKSLPGELMTQFCRELQREPPLILHVKSNQISHWPRGLFLEIPGDLGMSHFLHGAGHVMLFEMSLNLFNRVKLVSFRVGFVGVFRRPALFLQPFGNDFFVVDDFHIGFKTLEVHPGIPLSVEFLELGLVAMIVGGAQQHT